MITLFAILHVLFCLGLILFVLLQDPKGGSSSVFGGNSANVLLGTSGAANFLTKLTSWCAILFGATCLVMTILAKPDTTSVIDSSLATIPTTNPPKQPVPPSPNEPAAPGAATTGTGTSSAPNTGTGGVTAPATNPAPSSPTGTK